MVIHNQFLIELARNKMEAYIVLVYNRKNFLDLYLFRMYSNNAWGRSTLLFEEYLSTALL